MIIVVGNGIAGSCLSRHLTDRGLRHLVVSAGAPDSMAAAALLRRGYHHGDELALFDRSLELFKTWGVDVQSGGWVTNYRKPGKRPHEEADWHILDPRAPLVSADVQAFAVRHDQGVLVGDPTDAELIKADRVFWATGAVDATGITHGVTWTHPDPAVLTSPGRLRLHHYAPYKTIVAARVGGVARLGSSSAKVANTALTQAERMLATAAEVGMIRSLQGWRAVTGLRCKGTNETPSGIHFGIVGFHRTGYAIAPAATERLVEMLR
jgi:hypothetical protein